MTSEPINTDNAEEVSSIDEGLKDIRDKILNLLETYPYVSRAMIQVGLSPALPPSLWDPVLTKLVQDGVISLESVVVTNAKGTPLNKNVYHFPKYPFPPVAIEAATGEVIEE